MQATWTKVSTPSLMTSLYPTSHGVVELHRPSARGGQHAGRVVPRRRIRDDVAFVGPLHGPVHQPAPGIRGAARGRIGDARGSSKTAREYVDRFLAWLEGHPDTPFFAFLHVFDPHDPYEPTAPYDTTWADPAHKDEHQRQLKEVRKVIKDPLLRLFGMPSRDDLKKAGFDPEAFVKHDKDWYDGSIRGMDVEIGRLLRDGCAGSAWTRTR